MRKFKLIVCFTLIYSALSAQLVENDTISFKGVVFNENNEPMPNAHILINERKGTLTSPEGFFNFRVNASDSITFSYLGYKSFNFVVPDTLTRIGYVAGIFLKRDTLSLPEVVVLPWISKQHFRQAFVNSDQLSKQEAHAKANLNQVAGQTPNRYSYMHSSGVELQQKQFTNRQQYKGLISPDDMVSVGIPYAIGLIYNLATRSKAKQAEIKRMKKRLLEYKYFMERKKEEDQPDGK